MHSSNSGIRYIIKTDLIHVKNLSAADQIATPENVRHFSPIRIKIIGQLHKDGFFFIHRVEVLNGLGAIRFMPIGAKLNIGRVPVIKEPVVVFIQRRMSQIPELIHNLTGGHPNLCRPWAGHFFA